MGRAAGGERLRWAAAGQLIKIRCARLAHRRRELEGIGCKELRILCLQALPDCSRRGRGTGGMSGGQTGEDKGARAGRRETGGVAPAHQAG